ncbi:hypothetical protein [Candidatus Solirubrobacter pratensis]|uniref:hypothetical protein n=1 Tax=Candidatus Solirubrobacter pratensis TaxID=1298857 RepID=UPI00042703A8|nr:hypothetical protein [Candidatus Solirubrobacter pratensis]
MPRTTKVRWGIFVWDGDGNMGEGIIVGAYQSAEGDVDTKADTIRKASERAGTALECIVVPLVSGSTSARDIVDRVLNP